MDLLDSSGNWIIALGKTLVFSVLIGLLITSILKVILQFVSGKYSGLRYWLAVNALIIFTLSAGMLFFYFYSPVSVSPNEAKTAMGSFWSGGLFQNLVVNERPSTLGILYMISTYLYFGGILVMLIRLGISYVSIRGLKSKSSRVAVEWAQRFVQLKSMVGVGQKVELLLSERINVPGLIGVVKPAIIVPASMLSHLPASQVETIILHELYHIRRLDYLVNTVQLLLEALFFYNPAVWIISKQIRIEREKCCDDAVLEKTSRPEEYATALYQLAQQYRGVSSLSPSAAGTNQYYLLKRIKRILNQSTMKSNIREKLYALLLMAGGVILLFTLSGFSQGLSIIHHDYFSREMAQKTGESRSADVIPILSPAGPVTNPDPIPATIPDPVPETIVAPDTVPDLQKEEKEKAMQEALEEIDWEEIKEEIESAKQQALEEIDWEEIKKDMEAARKEVMEDIDWDEIKKDMEQARLKAFEEIDWESIKKEMENSRIHMDSVMKDFDFDFDIDFEEFDFDFEEFDIDLDQLKLDLEKAMEDMKNIDFEKMKADIEKSLAEIEESDVDQQ